MQIDFQRTGGFAGMRLAVTVDTDTLPAQEADELHQLVEEAHFFAMPATMKSAAGADRFTYKLTVKTDTQQHTVEVSEAAMPDSLQPLIDHLTTLARSTPSSKGSSVI